jgi:3,5-epimerase/4-reductase
MNFFKKTKVLIYGSKGWIGQLFIKYLAENYPKIKVVQGACRVDSIPLLSNEIKFVNPTHIISFIGRTHGTIGDQSIGTIDYLEYPGKLVENVRDNLFGPLTLADICTRKNIHFTYLGTGCIFNDSKKSFTEDSLPNFFGSGYSVVKGFTDRLMKNYPVLNLRIRMPIHSVKNERNFITKITNYSKICSIPNSMTVLDDFFPVFTDLLLKKKTGTYNCTNPGTISHNEILEEYCKIVDPDFKWENFSLEEQAKILKSDRSNNQLDTSKIKKEYPQLPSISESIKNILEKYKCAK